MRRAHVDHAKHGPDAAPRRGRGLVLGDRINGRSDQLDRSTLSTAQLRDEQGARLSVEERARQPR